MRALNRKRRRCFGSPDRLPERPALCDRTDEAIASTMCGFNEAWRLWIIAESFADLTNGDFEDGFADKGSWPDGVEKFLFCDELARIAER